MAKNNNNKKALAEKIKNYLNSPEYVAVPNLVRVGDFGPDLVCHGNGENLCQLRRTNILGEKHALIKHNDLEPTDWKEIINLTKKRNEEREKNYQAKIKKIEDKVNSQADLFYYYGDQSRNKPGSPSLSYWDKKGAYFLLEGVENGQRFILDISNIHSVLDNFPYEKQGFYLIKTDKPIERNDQFGRPWSDGGENNASNFHKWVEVGDQITITPYEVAEKPVEKPRGNDSLEKEKCAKCGEGIIDKYGSADWVGVDGKVYHSGCYGLYNDNNPNQPVKKVSQEEEKKVIEYLTKYFQQHNIKKISLKNGELIITHNNNNNNEIITDKQLTNNSEYRSLKNNLEKIGKNELTSQGLGIGSDNTSRPSSSKYLWIGGGIVIGIIFAGTLGVLYLSRKRKKNK